MILSGGGSLRPPVAIRRTGLSPGAGVGRTHAFVARRGAGVTATRAMAVPRAGVVLHRVARPRHGVGQAGAVVGAVLGAITTAVSIGLTIDAQRRARIQERHDTERAAAYALEAQRAAVAQQAAQAAQQAVVSGTAPMQVAGGATAAGGGGGGGGMALLIPLALMMLRSR